MKTAEDIDRALIEFYVRDHLDWRAMLKRKGFAPHRKFTNYYCCKVKLAAGLAVEDEVRQVSHLFMLVIINSEGKQCALNLVFGYPVTRRPDQDANTFDFKNMLDAYEVSFTYNLELDANVRELEKDIDGLAVFFKSYPFPDARAFEEFCNLVLGRGAARYRPYRQVDFRLPDLLVTYRKVLQEAAGLERLAAADLRVRTRKAEKEGLKVRSVRTQYR